MTLIESARLRGHHPEAYFACALGRIYDHRINCLDQLVRWT